RANSATRALAGYARLQDALGTGPLAREDEAVVIERDRASQPVGVRCRSEEEEEGGERDPLAVAECRRLELAVGAVQRGDLAASSDEDAGALEVVDQVVRHRLSKVGPAVEERHERATAGEPDRRLGGRVPAADDTDPRGAASPGLLWPRGVEDADAFIRLDLGDRKPAVLGAGRENDRTRPHLLAAREPDEVMPDARLERDGAVRRCEAGAKLTRLADGANRQL